MGENGIVPSGKLMALCQAGDESGDGFPKQCQPCESPMFCWVIGGSVGGSPSRSCPPARGWTLGAPRAAVYLQPYRPLAYLQDLVTVTFCLGNRKGLSPQQRPLLGFAFPSVPVTPPCFAFSPHLLERQHVLEAATLMQRVKKEIFGEAMSQWCGIRIN